MRHSQEKQTYKRELVFFQEAEMVMMLMVLFSPHRIPLRTYSSLRVLTDYFVCARAEVFHSVGGSTMEPVKVTLLLLLLRTALETP